jgi:hypothetical protein
LQCTCALLSSVSLIYIHIFITYIRNKFHMPKCNDSLAPPNQNIMKMISNSTRNNNSCTFFHTRLPCVTQEQHNKWHWNRSLLKSSRIRHVIIFYYQELLRKFYYQKLLLPSLRCNWIRPKIINNSNHRKHLLRIQTTFKLSLTLNNEYKWRRNHKHFYLMNSIIF